MTVNLKIYKTHPDIVLPKFQTDESACFDIAFQGTGKHTYNGYTHMNKHFTRPLRAMDKGDLYINAGERVLIPTGYILDIPKGYSVRLHARSGLSLKSGIILANSEAIIDSDYVDELMVLVYNRSDNGLWIKHGDRIAQGELVKKYKYDIVEIASPPKKKTDRNGGMGSTGV